MIKKLTLSRLYSLIVTHRALLCYLAIFLVACLVFVSQSSKILNPDGIEYVAIARHYLALDFHAAINGIWSPLLSWLFTIPMYFDVNHFLFFRLFTIIIAGLIIVIFNYLLRHELKLHTKSGIVYHGALIFITAFCFYATILTPVTPDLFSVLFILLFILFALRYARTRTISSVVLMGVIGGVGYYSKNYFFYFALAAILIYFSMQLFNKKISKKVTAIHLAIAAATCVLVVAPWIMLMTIKYGHFTINPIGDYSLAQVGPSHPEPPVLSLGLLSPPHEQSITAREDPTVFKFAPWSPTDSLGDMKYYITKVIPYNILVGIKILLPILIAILISILAYARSRRRIKNLLNDRVIVYSLIFGAIYVGGYCLQHLYGGFRYIWPAYIMFALALIQIVILYVGTLDKKRLVRAVSYIAFSVLVSLGALVILQEVPQFIRSSSYGNNVHNRIYAIERAKVFKGDERIASNDPYAASYLCYGLSLSCYGKPNNTSQLSEYKIDYVLNFPGTKALDVEGDVVYKIAGIKFIKLDR